MDDKMTKENPVSESKPDQRSNEEVANNLVQSCIKAINTCTELGQLQSNGQILMMFQINVITCIKEALDSKDASLLALQKEMDLQKGIADGFSVALFEAEKEITSLKAELEAEKQKTLSLELQVGKLREALESAKKIVDAFNFRGSNEAVNYEIGKILFNLSEDWEKLTQALSASPSTPIHEAVEGAIKVLEWLKASYLSNVGHESPDYKSHQNCEVCRIDEALSQLRKAVE